MEIAHDGKTALDIVHQYGDPIDFILLDLKMPVMDGVQFLRHMHKRAYPGPIGIISGEGAAISSLAIDLAKRCGLNVVGRLAKPFCVTGLEKTISRPAQPRMAVAAGSPAEIT